MAASTGGCALKPSLHLGLCHASHRRLPPSTPVPQGAEPLCFAMQGSTDGLEKTPGSDLSLLTPRPLLPSLPGRGWEASQSWRPWATPWPA